jgi:hypothetical protein
MTNKRHFLPKEYIFKPAGDDLIEMTVFGELIGRPSKRLALYQNKLKVVSAKIRSETKNTVVDYEIVRINHLPSFQEVRLHTKNLLYPGNYQITVTFRGKTFEEIKEHIESGHTAPVGLYWPSFGEIGSEVALSAA